MWSEFVVTHGAPCGDSFKRCTRTDADLIAHQDAVAVCCTVSSCPRPTGQRSANTDDRGNAHPYTNSCLRVPSPDQPQAT